MRVRFLGVMLRFVIRTVVMAVSEGVVVVVVRVPVGAMLKLAGNGFHPAAMMMRDMVVIVAVRLSRMSMRRSTPLAFSSLLRSLRRHLRLRTLVVQQRRTAVSPCARMTTSLMALVIM